MSWSLVLLSLCEGARDDAVASVKRAEKRQAEKEREKGRDSLGASKTAELPSTVDQMMESAFKKLWLSHARWAQQALMDAVAYADVNEPRSTSSMEQKDQKDDIKPLFYGSLWPSLKGRGWKEEENDKGKLFIYGSHRVRTRFSNYGILPLFSETYTLFS